MAKPIDRALVEQMQRVAERFGLTVLMVDSKGRPQLQFESSHTGTHSIDIGCSDEERAVAHFKGFVRSQPGWKVVRCDPKEVSMGECPVDRCKHPPYAWTVPGLDGYVDTCIDHAREAIWDVLWEQAEHATQSIARR